MQTHASPLQQSLSIHEVLHLTEDPAPLQAHLAELIALHHACTPLELAFAEELAFASWRRKRAWALETEFASKFQYLCDAVLAPAYRILHRDMLAAERLYQTALNRLTREVARRKREKSPIAKASAATPQTQPESGDAPNPPNSPTHPTPAQPTPKPVRTKPGKKTAGTAAYAAQQTMPHAAPQPVQQE